MKQESLVSITTISGYYYVYWFLIVIWYEFWLKSQCYLYGLKVQSCVAESFEASGKFDLKIDSSNFTVGKIIFLSQPS